MVGELAPVLDRLLADVNRYRGADHRIRLRVAIHEGLGFEHRAWIFVPDEDVTRDTSTVRNSPQSGPGVSIGTLNATSVGIGEHNTFHHH
ncbi:hypothetical protein [Paractinoplanes toevensis]|uniref:Uncharacterized protein n=1 Tax=Paractinoplanes toevensis TaxID=571911 RepID=A0A919WCQ7_9ACTN|nr:hypothetical protein [Actinoplanes toevensis]GIM97705.1 hypothetical protein Ato02nite_094980 [Actinoplanes toevensis]